MLVCFRHTSLLRGIFFSYSHRMRTHAAGTLRYMGCQFFFSLSAFAKERQLSKGHATGFLPDFHSDIFFFQNKKHSHRQATLSSSAVSMASVPFLGGFGRQRYRVSQIKNSVITKTMTAGAIRTTIAGMTIVVKKIQALSLE